jgi:hypothetical protein
MADRHASPARAEGKGRVSGKQITVVVAVLVGRLADAVGDDALGEDAADGDGLIEGVALIVGDGAGAQATSRAPAERWRTSSSLRGRCARSVGCARTVSVHPLDA